MTRPCQCNEFQLPTHPVFGAKISIGTGDRKKRLTCSEPHGPPNLARAWSQKAVRTKCRLSNLVSISRTGKRPEAAENHCRSRPLLTLSWPRLCPIAHHSNYHFLLVSAQEV